MTGKQVDALEKPLDGKFKPQLIADKLLKTMTDKRIFAFTNYGNCHKLDISDADLNCKLNDDGVSLKDLSEDAEVGEKVVAMFEVGDRLPYGQLLFFTKKGMIKKTDWAEYEQRKDSFQAVKLNEEDEVIGVEEDLNEDDTILMVTKFGMCLNAKKDDIPTQGRIATGVRGMMLQDGDSVILMQQINDEGEVIIVTTEGKFKKVLVSYLEPTKRYKKGSMIVGLTDNASILTAAYVTVPYMLAIEEKNHNVSELSSEDISIMMPSSKAKKLSRYAEDSVVKVIPMYYKKGE